MYPNMYQYQQPMPNYNTSNQLIRVTGIDGAKAYQMSANSTVALFDSGSDVMYIKSTDGAGFPTIRTFKFEEVNDYLKTGEKQIDFDQFITKTEFEAFKKELIDYGKQSISKSGKQTKQPDGE